MAVSPKKIGLLGGSFDPVHVAHTALAKAAHDYLQLDSVALIPTANPWQRSPLLASGTHRLAMLQLVASPYCWLHVNPIEIERGGKTYTIDTLRQLPPDSDYYWILGADQLNNFCSWHAWQEIAACVQLVVAARPGNSLCIPTLLEQHLDRLQRRIIHLPFPPLPVSATDIRHRLATRQSVNGLLEPAVAAYIQQHRLYEDDANHELTV